MSFHIVALPCDNEETWAHDLGVLLDAQHAEGFGLVAMTTRSVVLPQTVVLGSVTRYETQFVLVFEGDEA